MTQEQHKRTGFLLFRCSFLPYHHTLIGFESSRIHLQRSLSSQVILTISVLLSLIRRSKNTTSLFVPTDQTTIPLLPNTMSAYWTCCKCSFNDNVMHELHCLSCSHRFCGSCMSGEGYKRLLSKTWASDAATRDCDNGNDGLCEVGACLDSDRMGNQRYGKCGGDKKSHEV